MAIVVPQARKQLSADALFDLVRNGFAHIPDDRLGETDMALADAPALLRCRCIDFAIPEYFGGRDM
jgi:hypothetical protein